MKCVKPFLTIKMKHSFKGKQNKNWSIFFSKKFFRSTAPNGVAFHKNIVHSYE